MVDWLQLLLAKLKAGPLALEDIPKSLSITSVSGSRISSLYHTLRNVYNPLLAPNNAGEHSEADSHLQGLLMQLEAGLGSSLRQGRQVHTCACLEPFMTTVERNTHAVADQGLCCRAC